MALTIVRADTLDGDVSADIADIFVSNSGTEFEVFSRKAKKMVATFTPAVRLERFFVAMEKPNRVLGILSVSDGNNRSFAFDKKETRAALGFYKGTMGFYSLSDRFEVAKELPESVGFIEALAARGSGRHEGALKQLLDCALSESPYDELWVAVGDSNEAALAFYTDAGFEEKKRERYLYGQQGGHSESIYLGKPTNS